MSQMNVERIIGLLLTDESMLRHFVAAPRVTLQKLAEKGMGLNACELEALARLDPELLRLVAQAIDPRLQKVDLKGAMESRCVATTPGSDEE